MARPPWWLELPGTAAGKFLSQFSVRQREKYCIPTSRYAALMVIKSFLDVAASRKALRTSGRAARGCGPLAQIQPASLQGV